MISELVCKSKSLEGLLMPSLPRRMDQRDEHIVVHKKLYFFFFFCPIHIKQLNMFLTMMAFDPVFIFFPLSNVPTVISVLWSVRRSVNQVREARQETGDE